MKTADLTRCLKILCLDQEIKTWKSILAIKSWNEKHPLGNRVFFVKFFVFIDSFLHLHARNRKL